MPKKTQLQKQPLNEEDGNSSWIMLCSLSVELFQKETLNKEDSQENDKKNNNKELLQLLRLDKKDKT